MGLSLKRPGRLLGRPVSTFTASLPFWDGQAMRTSGAGPRNYPAYKADLNARASAEKAEILEKYGVDYLILGSLERQTYAVAAEKFQENMRLVFEQGQMQIFTREDSFGR